MNYLETMLRGIRPDAANVLAMFDKKRFSKIRNLHDIRLEKAKLRYEVLAAENRLSDSFELVGQMFSLPALIARFRIGMSVARKVYDVFSGLISWVSGKKKRRLKASAVEHGKD